MHKSTSNLSCGRYSSFDLTKRSISHLEDISQHASRRMAIMNEAEEQERKIVNEFCHLLEKSKQLFNGLRDLPQYGHKQWQAYFGRTFDVYTKLWKFQQQHRQVLDSKYALKRWQIGEIASKIGQLYYHYYLRTSETNYLNETFSFYAAIRARGYYSKASKEERRINHPELSPTTPDCLSASCSLNEKYCYVEANIMNRCANGVQFEIKEVAPTHAIQCWSCKNTSESDLMVKKLRYYARFIVVCLLLKKMKLVRDLVRELAKQIDDYTATYEPEDQLEWSLVLGEIKSFIEADNLVNIVDVDSTSVVLSHRLNPLNSPPVEKLPSNHLTLQEILIMGNCCDQVKFSELTLDMFRMLQTLEREPQEESTQIFDTSPAPGRIPFQPDNGDQRPAKRENPHKYLLYKPNINQLIVFLSSGFKELPPNGVLLLYMSADGCFTNIKHPEDATFSVREELEKATTTDCTAAPFTNFGYDYGGVATNSKREPDHINKRNVQLKDIHCLYPGDLYPLTRKPLFVIVDSDNSHAFQYIPRYFGQPVLVLMSPEDIPSCFHDQQHKGNLFTLFLHSPLTAVCFICNITDIPYSLWEKGQSHVDRFMSEASRLLIKCRNIDPAFLQFYGDDFLRLLILRFIFCCVVLRLHRLFMNTNFSPRSHPPLSEPEILEQPSLKKAVFELVTVLDVRNMFSEMEETD